MSTRSNLPLRMAGGPYRQARVPRARLPRGAALAVLASSILVIVLDSAMVNLAASTIRSGLDLTAAEPAAVSQQLPRRTRRAHVSAISMAVRDSGDGEAGLLSGIVNAGQQLGGAVGLAALAGLALGAAGTDGDITFTAAFLGGAVLAAVGVALSLILTRTRTAT